MAKSPAWTRKEGKNSKGGLNEKGRKSYERENPGSNLKAPQPEGGPRKRSFCARMEGMKKKLTSSKTAKDPNSRINKSLRKWKC
jgi:ribosomal protein S12